MTYSEKLKDVKWQKRRLELFSQNNWTCTECGLHEPKDGLCVHHVFYMTGKDPWEYPDETLLVLCNGCHEERQAIEQIFFGGVAAILAQKSIKEIKTFPSTHLFKSL
jgi:5-methylcytosine-specific restriction endonuclease McrA